MAKPHPRQLALQSLCEFDLARARVSLWVFKKRNTDSGTLVFSAHWVDIATRLEKELRDIANLTRNSFSEVGAYGLLEQPNETELLSLESSNTQFQALANAVDSVEEDNQAKNRKALDNAAGYVVKLTHKRRTLYCIRKATSDWRATKSHSLLNLVFVEQQLDIEQDPVFRVARTFDFFSIDGYLLVANKRAFESLLNFKAAYENSLKELVTEAEFLDLFTDVKPIQDYVATNAMQLRRMAVIRSKSLYKDRAYIARLRNVNAEKGWGIRFDSKGRIAPTSETARVILQVLLDHRLYSELTLATYDVPSTTPV